MEQVSDNIRDNIQKFRHTIRREYCSRQYCSHNITDVVSDIPWKLIVYIKEVLKK